MSSINDPLPDSNSQSLSTLQCDFCSVPEVRWIYPTRDFAFSPVPGHLFVYSGDWGTCDACHDFLSLGDKPGLTSRIVLGLNLDFAKRSSASAFIATEIDYFIRNAGAPWRIAPTRYSPPE